MQIGVHHLDDGFIPGHFLDDYPHMCKARKQAGPMPAVAGDQFIFAGPILQWPHDGRGKLADFLDAFCHVKEGLVFQYLKGMPLKFMEFA